MRHVIWLWVAACGIETGLSGQKASEGVDTGPAATTVDTPSTTTGAGSPSTSTTPTGTTPAGTTPTDDTGPPIDTGTPPDPARRVRTAGTELWLAYMENLTLAWNGPPSFAVVVEAPDGADGALEVPTTGFSQPFSLAPGEVAELHLPDAIWYADGSDVAGTSGVRVVADRPVEAVGVHYRTYFSEASRLLPREELGTTYRVIAVEDDAAVDPSAFVVVATEDGTEVAITPSTLTYGLRPEGVRYTVVLDAGETWQVQAAGDLSGTLITSVTGQPIAVFGGAREARVGCDAPADSHVWDQLLPLTRWGTRFHALPTARKAADTLVIVAHDDGTTVQLDCGPPRTLDAGEVWRVEVDGVASVTADRPVGVGQVVHSGDCDGRGVGDPSLTALAPAPLTRTAARVYGPVGVDTLSAATHHVSLIGGTVEVDGLPVDASAGAAVELSPGAHTLTGDAPFQGRAYGIAEYEAYT